MFSLFVMLLLITCYLYFDLKKCSFAKPLTKNFTKDDDLMLCRLIYLFWNNHYLLILYCIFKGGMTVGQLTNVGQSQALNLGISLREEYIEKHGLLSSCYVPSEIRYYITLSIS